MNACMGLFILWWGWIGFNAGSTYGITGGKWQYAARAGVGTTLATMAAGVFSILYSMYKNKGKVDVFEVISGILASLGETFVEIINNNKKLINAKNVFAVAINAGCFLFPSYISALVGVLAAYFALIALPFWDRL